MKRFYAWIWCFVLLPLSMSEGQVNAQNTGNLSNIVCFVRFADEDENQVFAQPFSHYEQMFNDETPNANSVLAYFKHSSYGQLTWRSRFMPQSDANGNIVSFQSKMERNFFTPYKEGYNDIGYKDYIEGRARLQVLMLEIAGKLQESLPTDAMIDGNGDGFVDNLCVVLSGGSALDPNEPLWPQRFPLLPTGEQPTVRGKRFMSVLIVFDESNGYDIGFLSVKKIPLYTGVICHEMSHSLGTPDLYHLNDRLKAVGAWDLMSDQGNKPQQMTAYLKMKYCRWIPEIPQISEPGTYTLNALGGTTSEKIAYKIQPTGYNEYFIVEYRKKEGYDSSIPASGLLIYRINPSIGSGNANYDGTNRLDEVYVIRPEETEPYKGNLDKAALGATGGYTAIGGNATWQPIYSDGTPANFAISNVVENGSTLSFTLEEVKKRLLLSVSELQLNGKEGSASNVKVVSEVPWKVESTPDWITPSTLTGNSGAFILTIAANKANNSPKTQEGKVKLVSTDGSGLTAELAVSQLSAVVETPSDLKAVNSENGVQLTWVEHPLGDKIFEEDFENPANPNGWQLSNTSSRGWRLQQPESYYKPLSGSYSAVMWEVYDPEKQDESLISPSFSQGQRLEFISRCNAIGLHPIPEQYYQVDISKDGGATWQLLADIKAEQPVSTRNKPTVISLNLTPYMSDNMKVRFHAYHDGEDGLSYHWIIDDVKIFGGLQAERITGYNVYRNGTLIATVEEPSYTDTAAPAGNNVYTVTAVGTFGETSPSNEAMAGVTTNIHDILATDATIVAVYTLSGVQVNTNLQTLPHGVYLVKMMDKNGRTTWKKQIVD